MKKTKKYSLKFFEKKFKQEKDSRVKLRIQMIMYLREGYTQREVSQMLKVSVGLVPYWKARFEKEGINGLRDKEGRGIKPQITGEQLSMLRSAIEEPILLSNGYTRGWLSKDVRIFLHKFFGLSYTRQHICRILNLIGCSLLVPRPKHKKRNKENVKKFIREFKKKEKVWIGM